MPQFASEATTHAFRPALPNPVRAAPSSDRASSSPFDSLIDDGTEVPASPPSQSPAAPADTTAAQSDSAAQTPAKVKGTKAAQAKGNTKVANAANTPVAANPTDAGNVAETDITVTNSKVPSDGKVKADTKLFEPAKAGDNSKPASDDKPADGTPPVTLAADPSTGAVQPIAPAVTVAIAAAPAPVMVIPAAPGANPQAAPVAPARVAPAALAQTVAAAQPALVAAGTPKTKAIDPADQQPDSGKSAENPKLSAKTTSNLQSDGNPQVVAGDADKPVAAYSHDEVPTATHHTSADTPPPIANDAQAAAPKTTGDVAQQALLTPPSQDVSPAPDKSDRPCPAGGASAGGPARWRRHRSRKHGIGRQEPLRNSS